MKGKPLTLIGGWVQTDDGVEGGVKTGRMAPDFVAVDNDLETVASPSFRGKVCVFVSVPSLDTSVCDVEVRRFNEEAASLGANVLVVTVSMDLPFAQKRWCGAAGVDRVMTLSDYREASFGKAYGVLIAELRLLARAVFVVDREGILRHQQLVRELTEEPNYDEVLKAVNELT
ncbi:MAG TPA: thiol peroxidase [Phycisphaerae bacterium]|nr:thiol peroxidase [Phycisphaerae bacterium]